MIGCREIDEYIQIVRSGVREFCEEQFLLCNLIEMIFATEDIYVDEDQLRKYLSYQKYFPFELLPWEKFCFALHNCTYYRSDNELRFPNLFIIVGRGAGKNGYLAFENFCLLTNANGVRNYTINTFANSEEQASTSFFDIKDMLDQHKALMKKHFKWTETYITCLDTNSEYYYCTSNPKSHDGGRPGKVDFDEIHEFRDYKLITVATTGMGKIAHPRRTYITTNGEVRGGPFDDYLAQCIRVLNGDEPDYGKICFVCRLDDKEEIHDKSKWHKANPSLYAFPTLQRELEQEYADFLCNPVANPSFMTKRMNMILEIAETCVTEWENILATNIPIDEKAIKGRACVAGIDYMKTTDMLGAGLLWRVDGIDYWIGHAWISRYSKDWSRIQAPLEEWHAAGLITIVDTVEIPPEIPITWLMIEAAKRKSQIMKFGLDSYRYGLVSKILKNHGFSAEKEYNNVALLRPSDEMLIIPTLTSGFHNHIYVWGDNPCMRWCCNNSKLEANKHGNYTYEKIEPKSRKTDEFKAWVFAECVSDILDVCASATISIPTGTYTY